MRAAFALRCLRPGLTAGIVASRNTAAHAPVRLARASAVATVCRGQPARMASRGPRVAVVASRPCISDQRAMVAAAGACGVALAAIATVAGNVSCEAEPAADMHTDVLSGLTFPYMVTVNGADHALVATGTRSVTFLGIYVYAAGLYVHKGDFATCFKDSGTTDASTLAFRDQFFTPSSVRKVLRVSPYRTAQFSHLRDGFGKAAESRAKQLDRPAAEVAYADIVALKALFPKGQLKTGEELLIITSGDVLHLEQNGKPMGQVTSPFLARALFESYLDDNPVSPDARKNFTGGLTQWLAAI
eukprot:m.36771 g.36771  ORF g.36771 m.36771 type:complete len:301 (-) comp11048_c0_seq2:138-1040(-)